MSLSLPLPLARPSLFLLQARHLSFARTRGSIRRATRLNREKRALGSFERHLANQRRVEAGDLTLTPRLPVTQAIGNCWEDNEKVRRRSTLYLSMRVRTAKQINMNAVRGRIFLPNPPYVPKGKKGSEVIAVFAEGKKAEEARALGIEHVGGSDMLQEILQGLINPSKIIATPSFERIFRGAQVGKILGPKGLIPSKRRGTVTEDLAKAVAEARSGIDFQADPHGLIRMTLNGDRLNPVKREQNVRHVLKFVADIALGGNGEGSSVERNTKGAGAVVRSAHLKGWKGKGVFVTDP
ncbi:ribosomal protein L1 [Atractiella rhizophila]|nr:ribosomal protein L1 [Atractiella rhizophila]